MLENQKHKIITTRETYSVHYNNDHDFNHCNCTKTLEISPGYISCMSIAKLLQLQFNEVWVNIGFEYLGYKEATITDNQNYLFSPINLTRLQNNQDCHSVSLSINISSLTLHSLMFFPIH